MAKVIQLPKRPRGPSRFSPKRIGKGTLALGGLCILMTLSVYAVQSTAVYLTLSANTVWRSLYRTAHESVRVGAIIDRSLFYWTWGLFFCRRSGLTGKDTLSIVIGFVVVFGLISGLIPYWDEA